MAMTLSGGGVAINAGRYLNQTQAELSKVMEGLASGKRVNSAADDASAYAISRRIESQVMGMERVALNAQIGVSALSVASSALNSATNLVTSLQGLALNSSSGTNSSEDRVNLNENFQNLVSEITTISNTTEFNGTNLLDGSYSTSYQVGLNNNSESKFSVVIEDIGSSAVGEWQLGGESGYSALGSILGGGVTGTSEVTANGITAQTMTVVGSKGTATAAIAANSSARDIATAINAAGTTGVTASAVTTATLDNISATGQISFKIESENSSAVTVTTNITDTNDLTNLADSINTYSDTTGVIATLSADKTSVALENAEGYSISVYDYDHGTNGETMDITDVRGTAISLDDTSTATEDAALMTGTVEFDSDKTFSLSSTNTTTATSVLASGTGTASLTTLASLDISTQTGAENALGVLETVLNSFLDMQADIGADMSTLSQRSQMIQVQADELQLAHDEMIDLDFSKATTAMTNLQVKQQAGTAMLAQANAMPQSILALLQ